MTRRVLTPVEITERHPNPRTGKMETWAAVSVEKTGDRPVWEFNRCEDEGSPWLARYALGGCVLYGSLPEARAKTASGEALALIEARRQEVA